jgi:hypothetical protein
MLACRNEQSEQVLKQVCVVGRGCSHWVISHEVQQRRQNQNGRTHRTSQGDSGAWCTSQFILLNCDTGHYANFCFLFVELQVAGQKSRLDPPTSKRCVKRGSRLIDIVPVTNT